MSELGDTFDALHEHNREKKRNNMEQSTKILRDRGINFQSKNNGVHLIVEHNGCTVDFWPSTGKFMFRKENFVGRGVFNLLKRLQKVANG